MKKQKILRLFNYLVLLIVIGLNSCNDFQEQNNVIPRTTLDNMVVSPDFTFSTTQNVNLNVYTLDNTGSKVPNIRVNIYSDLPENEGSLIMSGSSNSEGVFTSAFKLPAGTDTIAIGTDAIGFVNMQKIKISAGTVNYVLGGEQENTNMKLITNISTKGRMLFYPLGEYTTDGVPAFLDKENDKIDALMLEDINATLPEREPLTLSHPEYMLETNEPNLILKDECNVWVTFVHEGAGYKNSLMFYTYKTGDEPKNANDIDSLFVIFPNISYMGSGGGLVSGNRVHLGTFAPGTVIGWALASNGYDGKWVTTGSGIYYSNQDLNPETSSDKRKHTILINDAGRELFLLSFEDINRNGLSDEDFNDAVFYVTADPVQAVDASNIPLPDYTDTDKDNDGISDNFDDYPDDENKAFNNYYPSEGNVGSLAFEDLWPAEGDYDFNDLVVDYNFNQVTNGQNKVVQIIANLKLRATGASFRNGFGIQLPVSPELIKNVEGTSLTESFIRNDQNGTESGQSNASIIIFDNARNELKFPGGYSTGINTTNGANYSEPKTFEVIINLTEPVALNNLGTPPYNPFMIIDLDRTREVHLIDNQPTDLANKKLFGTEDDNSREGAGRYYRTPGNLPFAIDIAGEFAYPSEKNRITLGYLNFQQWGRTGGVLFYDWYRPVKGYRDEKFLFTR